MNDPIVVDSGDRLSFTIFLAIAVHALLIFGVGFTLERGKKVAPTLNITLSTHESKTTPDKADFLAQHNQQASGTINEAKELTTKELALFQDVNIKDVSPSPQQKARKKRDAETRVITTVENPNRSVSIRKKTDEEDDSALELLGEEIDTPLMKLELASLQAKLDLEKQQYARIPRIHRLTSMSTKASDDADYLNAWEQKIKFIGNKNFPEEARTKKIYGNLRLAVLILPDGTVEQVEILQSSGHGILDEASKHIVRLASPFEPFPKQIRKKADKLEIIRTWQFEITGLKTSR